MMNRKVFSNLAFILILGLILIFSACGTAQGNKASTAAPSVSASTAATASESTAAPSVSASTAATATVSPLQSNSVNIKDYKFAPETIEIKKGDKVIWKNEDGVIHTVTFDTFDSGSMKQGDTFEHTFDTAGSFSYYCGNHPSMKGTVKVK